MTILATALLVQLRRMGDKFDDSRNLVDTVLRKKVHRKGKERVPSGDVRVVYW